MLFWIAWYEQKHSSISSGVDDLWSFAHWCHLWFMKTHSNACLCKHT